MKDFFDSLFGSSCSKDGSNSSDSSDSSTSSSDTSSSSDSSFLDDLNKSLDKDFPFFLDN